MAKNKTDFDVVQKDIHIGLHPNLLKNGDGKYIARINKNKNLSVKKYCEFVNGEYPNVSIETIAYLHQIIRKSDANLLSWGYTINCDYYSLRPFIKGSFNSHYDKFDPQRHELNINILPSNELRKMLAEANVLVYNENTNSFVINKIINMRTKEETTDMYENDVLRIKGTKIKIVGDDPNLGLHFKHIDTEKVFSIQAYELIENHNNKLMFIVPPLPAGAYEVSIITQYAGNSIPLLQARIYTYRNVMLVHSR